jgi:hypothetical protein
MHRIASHRDESWAVSSEAHCNAPVRLRLALIAADHPSSPSAGLSCTRRATPHLFRQFPGHIESTRPHFIHLDGPPHCYRGYCGDHVHVPSARAGRGIGIGFGPRPIPHNAGCGTLTALPYQILRLVHPPALDRLAPTTSSAFPHAQSPTQGSLHTQHRSPRLAAASTDRRHPFEGPGQYTRRLPSCKRSTAPVANSIEHHHDHAPKHPSAGPYLICSICSACACLPRTWLLSCTQPLSAA